VCPKESSVFKGILADSALDFFDADITELRTYVDWRVYFKLGSLRTRFFSKYKFF
jgi:hypothetical protein